MASGPGEVRLSETSPRQKKSDDSVWDCPIFLKKNVINSSVCDDFGGDASSILEGVLIILQKSFCSYKYGED